ncbi:MAG: hypothetical protein ABW069_11895 [Duganella sp.]
MTSPLSNNWSPQFHFPWSGGVQQRIDPDFNWFAHWITPGAGNPSVEERAFTDVASYGMQLGLITDVLLALEQKTPLTAADDAHAVGELHRIRASIRALKALDTRLSNDKIVALVADVNKRGGSELTQLAALLQPLLAPQPPDVH